MEQNIVTEGPFDVNFDYIFILPEIVKSDMNTVTLAIQFIAFYNVFAQCSGARVFRVPFFHELVVLFSVNMIRKCLELVENLMELNRWFCSVIKIVYVDRTFTIGMI